MEGPLEIDIDYRPESVRRKVFGSTQEVSGRTVDQYVQPAQLVDGLGDGGVDGGGVPDVGNHRHRPATMSLDLCRSRLEVLTLAARDGDIAAV